MIPAARPGENVKMLHLMYAEFQSASRSSASGELKSGRETSKAYPIPRHYGDPWNILLALYKRMNGAYTGLI